MPLSTSHSSSQCDVVDIVQTPASPRVQPVMSNYPATIFSGKARSFRQAWYSLTLGWNIPYRQMLVSATAVVCLEIIILGLVLNARDLLLY